VLHSQKTIEFHEDTFAALFGVTARHLRRLFVEEIGKTPKQLSFENRLNFARKLITETALPITEIVFASGFSSIRRFNDAFKDRFKKPPREIRRSKVAPNGGVRISLPYRPPFDFEGLMASYEHHRVGNLERFANGTMHRVISSDGKSGRIAISNDPKNSSLIVDIDLPDTSMIHAIISRVRNLFDLDSDPVVIANSLDTDAEIRRLLKENPGIRLPSGWDPFEVAISAILGQLVSVEHSRSLMHDLIEITGKDSGLTVDGRPIRLFPTPLEIVQADLSHLKIPAARKQTLIDFSKAVHEKTVSLESTQDVDEFLKQVLEIKGIGTWTANYMALKALRHTDAFPSSDLILARALDKHPKKAIESMAPWRGYVAALFWRTYAGRLKKTKQKQA
jgi:AraC family transcriptional regulator of adaptative response / DNA-3-methyladenine glycosylase II